MSRVLRCYLIGVSLHLVIFKKRSMRLCSKRFSNLSSKIFMGFYFGVAEKRFYFGVAEKRFSLRRG
jgi:hypothetical protein